MYAKTYWGLVVNLLAHHAWSGSYHSECMPDVSSGILDSDIGKATAAMAKVKLLYEVVERAEMSLEEGRQGSGLSFLRDLMKDFASHELVVAREKWALARGVGWDIVDPS